LSLVYPVNDYDGFFYNPDNKNGYRYSSNGTYMGKRVTLSNRARYSDKNWANVYANLDIKLPTDQASKIKLVSGSISAENFNNRLTLDTSSGSINVRNAEGNLLADSSSGEIDIANFEGQVNADSSSGRVVINNITGDIDADTSSGSVNIDRVTGYVKADTSSGSVTINDFLGGELLDVDTSSGSVKVNGDLSNLNKLKIDTNSGSVRLTTTEVPSLDIEIDTGSGGINVDLPNLNISKDKRGYFEGSVGGGKGKASIDTSSGSVRFEMDDDYVATTEITEEVAEISESESNDIDDDYTNLPENEELAARVRNAINKDSDLRKANLDITARGNKVFIEGSVDNLWDIAKTVKIANSVDGVEGVSIDF